MNWNIYNQVRWGMTLVISLLTLSTFAQSQRLKGYPQRSENMDVLTGFRHPPKGYGNVPFYWWSGDTLTRERLAAQLDILCESATDGFAVSYIHTHPKIDSLFNKQGYGLFGRTEPGAPAVFSEQWWDIWKWFSGECAKRGVAVGLDDYTVGWIGNGYYPDEVEVRPDFQNYQGKLKIETFPVKKGEKIKLPTPENHLTTVFWPGAIKLDTTKEWTPQIDGKVFVISTQNSYILHPEYGKALVDVYFNRFEQKMTPQQREGMNYFFQDELSYPIDMLSWSSDFQQEFTKRKGYDITPYLPALKEYIGEITPKVRLDYAEVLTDLADERYYKPIFDWHAERGLIYGSDNLGRGRDPLAYVDYFRANSWYTAPGNDAPSKGSSFIQTKVSSSIAHLYNRPRTWLEAFHSMGWGSSGEWLTQQIDHHFIAGGNLVCMHGLYYSTHGGWWEWAPPCFHFRMPYWPHMKSWLEYTERMSYLLSQGDHVCDIALMYPTESMQAYPDATPQKTFATAKQLSDTGLDYDFLDFRSLREAEVKDKALHIGHERYRVMVLSDMRAMHYSSLLKLREFYRAGGIVLATGALPEASSRKGEKDEKVDDILIEIFGLTATDANAGKKSEKITNKAGGIGLYIPDGTIHKAIPNFILPDFVPNEKGGKVLHRRIGERDLYMVTNVEKGSECFFRSVGKVELWNATDGTTSELQVLRQDQQGTWIRMDKEYTNSYLVVFSPGKANIANGDALKPVQPDLEMPLEGEWRVELLPTLDNKWGDYRLPASNEMIGAEARTFEYKAHEWTSWNKESIYGFGPQAIHKYGPTQEEYVYDFSWEYGVWNQPGSQGYHGLKSKVSDGFFILDKGGKQTFNTYIYVRKAGEYRIEQYHVSADLIQVDGTAVKNQVYLTPGWHSLVAVYENTVAIKPSLVKHEIYDFRNRGAVVLLPKDAPAPIKPSIYADRVSMAWTSSEHLMFDPYQGKYSVWDYRFKSVPGMKSMKFAVYGQLKEVTVQGRSMKIMALDKEKKEGINRYEVILPKCESRCKEVVFSIKTQAGRQGTLAIAEPVKIETGEGLMEIGDWSKVGALRFYSGGMIYRKTLTLEKLSNNQTILNLGNVVASCEVKVNGKSAGMKMSPPYNFDMTSLLQAGENEIEVLVYSTLANHYQTQPTPYKGEPIAGIIGPVKIEVYK